LLTTSLGANLKKSIVLPLLSFLVLAAVGCGSSEPVPIADKQDKTPPSNTLAGQAVKKFREKRGGPMGPNGGATAAPQ